jgi:transposase
MKFTLFFSVAVASVLAATVQVVHADDITLNGHDLCAYPRDVLNRLPTHSASRVDELLPHRWQAQLATI